MEQFYLFLSIRMNAYGDYWDVCSEFELVEAVGSISCMVSVEFKRFSSIFRCKILGLIGLLTKKKKMALSFGKGTEITEHIQSNVTYIGKVSFQ